MIKNKKKPIKLPSSVRTAQILLSTDNNKKEGNTHTHTPIHIHREHTHGWAVELCVRADSLRSHVSWRSCWHFINTWVALGVRSHVHCARTHTHIHRWHTHTQMTHIRYAYSCAQLLLFTFCYTLLSWLKADKRLLCLQWLELGGVGEGAWHFNGKLIYYW